MSELLQEVNKKKRKELIILLASSSILIVALLFFISILPLQALSSSKKEQDTLSMNSESSFALEQGEVDLLHPFTNEYIVKLSNDLVSFLSLKGEEEYAYPIQTQKVISANNNQYFLVADQNAFNFYLFNKQGLVFEGKTDAPISQIAVSENGSCAFIMDEANTKGVLRVLNQRGKHQFDWRVRDPIRSGFLLDMVFSQDSSQIHVSLVNTDGSELKPILNTLSIETAEIISSIHLENKEVYPLFYGLKDGSLLLMGASGILHKKDLQVKEWIHMDQIYEIAPSENGISLLASRENEIEKQLYYFPFSDLDNPQLAEVRSGVDVGREPYALTMDFQKIAVATEGGIYIMKKNEIMDTNFFSTSSPVVSAKFLTENHLLLILENSVQVIKV